MPRRQVPRGRDVRGAAPRFGDHLARHQQPELDPDAGEADTLAARLRARRHVVISRQLPPLHPAPVVHHRERRLGGVGDDADAGGAGVERVGDDLGEDRLLERAAVSVSQVFEQVLEVDARFAHSALLLRLPRAASPREQSRSHPQAPGIVTRRSSGGYTSDRA